MTTIRRWWTGTAATAAALAFGAMSLAADPPAQRTPGISGVTNGQGVPLNLQPTADASKSSGVAAARGKRLVKRGRAWWPYAAQLPPYTAVGKRAESMAEDEIAVNGTATLSVRDPGASLQNAPKELVLEAGSQLAEKEGFYLVKIQGFSRTQEQIDALTRAGAVLGEYLNINTYVAKIPSADYAAVKNLPFVSFVGDYHPAYKISPRIGLDEVPESEAVDAITGQAKPWAFEITLHKGAYVYDVLNALARLAIFPQDDDIVANGTTTVLFLKTVPDAIPAIAMIPGVKFIAEKGYPRLHASSSNPAAIPMVLQNNGAYTTTTGSGWKLWNQGIDGTGQIVTVMDTGLNTKLEHFAQDTLNVGALGPSHRKVVGYDVYGGGDQCVLDGQTGIDGGHGAKTSQHAVGSISNMTANQDATHTPNANWDNGVARGAKLYFQDIGFSDGNLSPPADMGPSITAAIGKGSFIQNDSWGETNRHDYDSLAANIDAALFSNPNFVVTVSAGNTGQSGTQTLTSPATAKNVIAVGGNDVAHPDNLFIDCNWDFTPGCDPANDLGSSRGPVQISGRVKPDIMAYMWASTPVGGEQMAIAQPTAMCQTDATKTVYFDYTNIGNEGGTSFSSPEIAGLAALVRDYFQKGFYPTGAATPANALTPAGSLVKAVILASGEAMAATAYPTAVAIGERYSSDVGYGRANLPAALHLGPGAPFLSVQNDDTVPENATRSFFYTINGNQTPLRVMMDYYDDAAGEALQKDADLKVTIGGNVYWGNNFSGSWSTTATSTRDHTNNTEGVFLDQAHGLPVSGTVRVDVIGFNNPNGMKYSLVVAGDVADQASTQVALEKGKYTCSEDVKITVNDVAATSPVSVTVVSKNSSAVVIDTKVVSCSGSGGKFTGTIRTGSGIVVADGGSLTATYPGAIAPASAAISCQLSATDAGFAISGGCDDASAGADSVSGPLVNGGVNEFYTKYMDAGEYSSYTFKFTNRSGAALADAVVNVGFSGAGAAKMSALNNPVHVGFVPVDATAGAVFQVFTDPSATGLTAVDMNFDITSPGDGFTIAKRITQTQLLQANDVITRLQSCATFDAGLSPFAESTAVSHSSTAQNIWRWSGSATTPSIVKSETRTDGVCGSATPNAAAMVGNSPTSSNFANFADSFLYLNFAPANVGNGPSGQPWHYVWKWHSFYHASELTSNKQSGIWGSYYNDAWNKVAAPTGDELRAFPFSLCCFNDYQVFDYPAGATGTTWDWETANTGTPDDPHFRATTGGAPNQTFVTFSNVTGLATASTRFAYGHRHADLWWFSNPQIHGTHRDVALDNDRLVYDEYYAAAQAASCSAGSQLGHVAFDLSSYVTCPHGSAVLSVTDANGASGLQVTVTSPGTGDSEVVTLTGTGPYFSGTLNLSTDSGVGANNGVLFVLPSETITAAYTDSSPAGSTTATAVTDCGAGDVSFVSYAQVSDNGDNDGFADNNETVTIDITIQNNLATALENAKVTILADSPNIDCISDSQALYGTIPPGAQATNPAGDRFAFHVAPAVACSDGLHPPTARFIVLVTGDGLQGTDKLQSFFVDLDLDSLAGGGSYTYTQSFTTDPGWTSSPTPDDSGLCGPYSNSFHWCAACGNGSGGYGAWIGNSAFGTSGQNYPDLDSSTLYSPKFVANGNVGLGFKIAYRTELSFDGAKVQYRLNSGTWTDLTFTTPPQQALTTQEACSPFPAAATPPAWTGSSTGTAWTTTNTATVPSSVGQTIQFRWRLGTDESVKGSNYGGLGVDDVTITNLKQTVTCEPTRNSGLPACPFCLLHADGTACDDGNPCTDPDVCASGSCVAGPPAPAEAQSVQASSNKTTYTWTPLAGATRYDAVRGTLASLPVGPGGAPEICFDNLPSASLVDGETPTPGVGFWYVVRGENGTCNGTYGSQSSGPRITTTCQ